MQNIIVFFTLTVIVRTTTGVCVTGWIEFQDKCYFFSHGAESWAHAASICEAFNSKLAEPRNTLHGQFLRSYAMERGHDYWIGLTDLAREGHFVYASSREEATYSDFDSGEPNNMQHPNGHTEQCIQLRAVFKEHMNDYDCDAKVYFICETDNK